MAAPAAGGGMRRRKMEELERRFLRLRQGGGKQVFQAGQSVVELEALPPSLPPLMQWSGGGGVGLGRRAATTGFPSPSSFSSSSVPFPGFLHHLCGFRVAFVRSAWILAQEEERRRKEMCWTGWSSLSPHEPRLLVRMRYYARA